MILVNRFVDGIVMRGIRYPFLTGTLNVTVNLRQQIPRRTIPTGSASAQGGVIQRSHHYDYL